MSIKRRIAVVITAAMLAATMAVGSAAPAFACGHHGHGHPQCNKHH